MRKSRDFDIAFVGLKPGKHEFFYSLEEEQLEDIAETYSIENPKALVKLELDKKEGFLDLKFQNTLKGNSICDRCGTAMDIDLWDEFEMILKFSSQADEDNSNNDQTDIHFISRTESKINVMEWILETLSLMVPMNMVHDEGKCDPESLSKLEMLRPQNQKKTIWKGLDNIKFDN